MPESQADSTAGVISALASLASALSWPILAGIVLYGIYNNLDKIGVSINKFMDGKSSAKIGLSATNGFTLEIVEKTVATSVNAVIESSKKSPEGSLNQAQISQVAISAQSAALSIAPNALNPQKKLKVLWVDDHPENNIDLQFALQTLGIIVICIDSNNSILQAFDDASGYDVVITDMGRDEMGGGRRQADPEGGLKTVETIRKNYPKTKVIIYAASWAVNHRNDPPQSPVILVTNYTQEVYQTVVNIAINKAL